MLCDQYLRILCLVCALVCAQTASSASPASPASPTAGAAPASPASPTGGASPASPASPTGGAAPASPASPTGAHELPTDGIILICGEDSMTVTIPISLLGNGVQGNDLMFQNSPPGHCYGEINGDNVVLNTSLTDCGTERTEDATHEVYSNVVVNSETSDTISRQYKVEIPVNCSYSRSGSVSQAWYRLTDYILDKDLEETGSYIFDLKFYDDRNFTEPIQGYPYVVNLNEELYFAATLGSEEYSDLDLSIKSCKATDNADDNDSGLHYDLITDWEAQEDETQLACHSSTTPDNQDMIRVTTRAFRFVELGDNHETVYIHCELFVCAASASDSVCKEQCQNNSSSARRRRDVSPDSPPLPIQRLTRGPIRFRRAAPVPDDLPRMQIQDGGNPDVEMSPPFTMWGLVAVVMGAVVIVLLAALVVTLRKLAATTKTEATRKNDEESARLFDEDSD